MNKLSLNITLCVGSALLLSACIARSADDYRTVTRGVVDTKQAEIEGCFGETPAKVVVNFTVEKKTGKISNATIDSANSTASQEVGDCVLASIDGLAIERPDMRDGAATFTWELGN